MATKTEGGLSFDTQTFVFGQRINLHTNSTDTEVLSKAIESLASVDGDLISILGSLFDSEGGEAKAPTFGYDPSVKWLAGIAIEYGVLSLDVLMIDGAFYGIKIKIGKAEKKKKKGEKGGGEENDAGGESGGKKKEDPPGPLEGLSLEIIYRKINDHLGEYSADLTLPKKYKTITLGEPPEATVITLPSVGLAIWTNGDFKISVGWPLGDRSFNISFPPDPIPWAGGGGFYFARLRSEDNPGALGTHFNPIIEFGIGIRVGAATEGKVGIAKYAASLYLFGTFQGFLAWEDGHSFSDGVDYYWFCATVGITGHLEGSVDFVVIKASLSLDITASLTLAIETGHVAQGIAEFKATVKASIKVLFITIHFSFTLDLKQEVKFGSGDNVAKVTGPTPDQAKILTPDVFAAVADTLVEPMVAMATRVLDPSPIIDGDFAEVEPAMARMEFDPGPEAEFAPIARSANIDMASNSVEPVVAAMAMRSEAPVKPVLDLYLVLQPTIYFDDAHKPISAGVASLIIERAAPDNKGANDDAFANLIDSMTSFLMVEFVQYHAVNSVTSDEINHVLAMLGSGGGPTEFTNPAINHWLNQSFTLTIRGVTPDSTYADAHGAVFPMIPGLSLTYDGTTTVFGEDPPPSQYLKILNDYMAAMHLLDGEPPKGTLNASTEVPTSTWFPGVVFEDYFNLLGQQVMGEILDLVTKKVDGKLPAPMTLAEALAKIDVGNLAGIGTRFLQHGMRVPEESPENLAKAFPDMEMRGLYEMTGQQFVVADPKLLNATVSVDGSALIDVTIGKDEETAKLPFTLTHPPTQTDLWNVKPLKRLTDVPLTVMLRQGVPWTQDTNKWQLFGFPDPLQDELRQNQNLNLHLTSINDSDEPQPVNGMEALMMRFSLKVIPGLGKDTNIFQVNGTNEETRDLLELLLANSAELGTSELDLLVPAGKPNSNSGFQTSAGDSKVMLLKTNLSSTSHPDAVGGPIAMTLTGEEKALGPTHAQIDSADPTDFLRLLWECSVVHTGGFYLFVPDLKPTSDAFSGQKQANVALLVKKRENNSNLTSSFPVDIHHNAILVNSTKLSSSDRVQAAVFDSANNDPIATPQPNYHTGTAAFGTVWKNPPNDIEATDSTNYANSLYQLLQYQIIENSDYDGSPWSMALGPDGDGTKWTYRRAAPVLDFLKKKSTNKYDAIGKPVSILPQLLDVFGNAIAIDTLENVHGLGASGPIEMLPVYNDRLSPMDEWPATVSAYAISAKGSGTVELSVTILFQPENIQHKDTALPAFQTVLAQLIDGKAHLNFTSALSADAIDFGSNEKAQLIGFIQAIVDHLNTGTAAPKPLVLTSNFGTDHVAHGIGEDLFPIWVTMQIKRDAPAESPAFDYPNGFISVASPIPPLLAAGDEDEESALRTWSMDFEAGYNGFDGASGLLKVLVGKPPNKIAATKSNLSASATGSVKSAPGDLWAMKWSPKLGVGVTFGNDDQSPVTEKDAPVYFAPLPLSTALLNGIVDVYHYDANGKRTTDGLPTQFNGVDLDGMARNFLQAFDDLMAPEMATAIAQVDGAQFDQLLTEKEHLAQYISNYIAWVYEDQLDAKAGDKSTAATQFRESLLVALGNDYATSSIVQAPATVVLNGAFEAGQQEPPQLFGGVSPEDPKDLTTLKQFTISNAALEANPADPAYLTFLAGAVHPTDKADLCLRFSYDMGFIQHYFEESEEAFDYTPSSWLRFVLPSTDPNGTTPPALNVPMGQLDIPIPLRAYPSPPRLIQQLSIASNPQPASIEDALKWNYTLTVQRPVAAQDDLHIEVEFNAVENGLKAKAGTGGTLFEALAQFNKQYPLIDTGAISKQAANADNWLKDITELVTNVSTAWKSHVEIQNKPTTLMDATDTVIPAPVVWNYILQIPDENPDGAKVVTMWWNGPKGSTPPAWPTMGGVAGQQIQTDPVTYQYTLADDQWDQLQISWENLNVVSMQSAETSAFIKRNETLSGCGGKKASSPTNPAFVYTTDTVTFANPIVPLIAVNTPIAIQTSSVASTIVSDMVEKIMPDAPVGDPSQIGLNIGTSYQFSLTDMLTINLPVLVAISELSNAPTMPEGFSGPSAFGNNVVKSVVQWHTEINPSDKKSSLLFDVTIFAANSQQPIAQLSNVTASISGTDWWKVS